SDFWVWSVRGARRRATPAARMIAVTAPSSARSPRAANPPRGFDGFKSVQGSHPKRFVSRIFWPTANIAVSLGRARDHRRTDGGACTDEPELDGYKDDV